MRYLSFLIYKYFFLSVCSYLQRLFCPHKYGNYFQYKQKKYEKKVLGMKFYYDIYFVYKRLKSLSNESKHKQMIN